MSETISRSWFVVFNNPKNHGYSGTPEEILNQLKDKWIGNNQARKCIMTYCISAQGLEHVHMVLEGSGAMRFSAIKKVFKEECPHLEPTRASKSQVMAYVRKEKPYDEKGEVILAIVSVGNIEGNKRFTLSNKNQIMDTIEQLIDEGKNPNEIMSEDIRLRKEETLIKKMYFAKRLREVPPLRDISVIYHLGDSGVGKSYSYVKLCEEYGEDNVYLYTDFANKGIGGLDDYYGAPILFMDELKPNSLNYETLLQLLQGYKTQIHCRFTNSYSLWDTVHITSIYPPEELYEGMVEYKNRSTDSLKQLLRRINKIEYHYKDGDEFKIYEMDGRDYKSYDDLKEKAFGVKDEDIKPFLDFEDIN